MQLRAVVTDPTNDDALLRVGGVLLDAWADFIALRPDVLVNHTHLTNPMPHPSGSRPLPLAAAGAQGTSSREMLRSGP